MATPSAQIGTEQLNLVPGQLLLVDNPDVFSEAFRSGLDCLAQAMTCIATGADALDHVAERRPHAILVPHALADMSGLEFLSRLRDTGSAAGVVLVVQGDQRDSGAQALDLGAQAYLIEPLQLEQAVATLALVARLRQTADENDGLLRRMNALKTGSAILGHSPAARRLTTVLARAAESSVTVLVDGPVGSGKSLAAQVIHASGRLSGKRFEVAFGDALTLERLDGLLQDPDVGTLLLENVEHLVPEAQSRVVRYIKEQSGKPSERLGARIMATTSSHLPELVARARFREDLFYRLNVFPITVPSLRERRDDIAELASHFLSRAAERTGDPSPGFTDLAIGMLEGHSWPGNIGQLQDTIVRAHLLARGAPIDRRHLQGVTTGMAPDPAVEAAAQRRGGKADEEATEDDILPLEAEEKRLLARALRATQGNVRRAAQLLRIGRATLYRKIQVYQLKLN